MSVYNRLNREYKYPRFFKDILKDQTNIDSNIKHIKSTKYDKQFSNEGKLTYRKNWDEITEFEYDKNGILEKIIYSNWDSRDSEFSRYDFLKFNYFETDENSRIVIINDVSKDNRRSSIEIIDYYENNGNRIEEHRVYEILLNIGDVLPKYVIINSNQLIINNDRLDTYYKYKNWECEITNLIVRVYDKCEGYEHKEMDEEYVQTYYLGLCSKKIFDVNNRCSEHTVYKFNEESLPYFGDSFFKNTENIDSNYLEEFYIFFTSGTLSDANYKNNIYSKSIYTYDENNCCFAEVFDSKNFYKMRNLVFDNNKNIIKDCIVYNNSEVNVQLFEYDKFGNITKELKVNCEVEVDYQYEYNARNKWIKKFKNNKLLIERQVEYYI